MNFKKVMIHAYCNFNLGDDLFIKILSERYPETQFILYAPKGYKHQLDNSPNIKVYSSSNVFNRLSKYISRKTKKDLSKKRMLIKKSDINIRIGGSIFMQKDNSKHPQLNNKLEMKKPYFILGANFGPYKTQRYYEEHYEHFKQCTDVCFRDQYSYELFKNLNNVRQADDIVFQLKDRRLSQEKNSILLSVIQPSYRKELESYDEMYYKKIKEIICFFIEKKYKIILMSFCENEGDQIAIENIISLLPSKLRPNVEQHYYKYDTDAALEIISSASYVIATRFHAMILGWLYNKPVFPISYSKKMNNVMHDIKYSGTYIDLQNIDTLNIEEVYKGMDKNKVNITSQKKNAELHFKELDKLLL